MDNDQRYNRRRIAAVAASPPEATEEQLDIFARFLGDLAEAGELCQINKLESIKRGVEAVLILLAHMAPAGDCASPPSAAMPWAVLETAIKATQEGRGSALFAPSRKRKPDEPRSPTDVIETQAFAAAVMTLLMKACNYNKRQAARVVAEALEASGFQFTRKNTNPTRTVEYWREIASDPNSKGKLPVQYHDLMPRLEAELIRIPSREGKSTALLDILRSIVKGYLVGMVDDGEAAFAESS